ncbi:MAG: hypothetical protein PHQ91_06590 [Thermoanaerobaculaceae bacterium]|nr:hypothetical protein [Thermoanaerobaculaceae bacterium]TAM56120.1 MAG: hypothetical protein EPN53_02120 [Acidobacteriota bacterium]
MGRRGSPRPPAPGRASVEVFAPLRADLAGGTLDLWPLYCLHPGAITINAALARGVRLRLTSGGAPAGSITFSAPGSAPRVLGPDDAARHLAAAVGFHIAPAGGFAVEVIDQPPVGSGLGASSTLAVALARGCLALAGRRLPVAGLVALLRDLESRVLGVPAGVQDYLPALLGGILAIHLEPGGERVERIGIDRGWLAARLVVVYSGITHASGMVNWQVYRARIDGDPGVARRLDAIARAAIACRLALLAGDETAVGRAIAAEWRARRELASAVTSPALDAVLAAGAAAGALAGKACGAGGGGSVLFWVPPGRRGAVRAAAVAAAPGAFEIAGGVAARGATVRSGRATMSSDRG